jgi:hypothetical protein
MSLLDGPHQLVVLDMIGRVTAHGTALSPTGALPARVRGSLQPSTATEDRTQGTTEVTQRRWISRTFPTVSIYAQVVSLGEFHGVQWELVGAPQFYGTGRRTRHWEAQLRRIRQLTEDEVEAFLDGEPRP